MVAFAAGFILLWSLGSWLVGGGGFPGGGSAEAAITAPVALSPSGDYNLSPLVDMRAFRDLSYVPVKGVYVTSFGAASSEKLDKVLIPLADSTEINAFVIDVKDDRGYVTYDADVPLAKEEGLIDKRIKDIDALIAKLRAHNIIPIARVVCFKDDKLADKRPDLAVKWKNGTRWTDL
ncbi:MAG: putative glycoside hydrolase, partial [Actinobacteria bacterium]|nr:putative glycoside hydrolase [Actinomycetota bacterium]